MLATSPVITASGESSDKSKDTGDAPKKLRKRRRLRYNLAYHDFVKSTVDEINSGSITVGEPQLQPSQVGFTFWSSEEKEKLFMELPKKGKDNLKAIAEAIGSKSEPEVHVYLQLLQQMTELQHLSWSYDTVLDPADVPAAFEISEACTDVLDAAACAILVKEQEKDKEQEREVFGDLWLLDESVAKSMADPKADDGTFKVMSDHPSLQHALGLLDLKTWLELSSRIFMNPLDPTDNWRSYVEKGQTPSIYTSAFIDFHSLAVTVTKRLVSSAIFFAKSRLRATNTKKHGHGKNVRREDVMAAVDVLGMEADAVKFWHGAARRCRLDVYESVRIKKRVGKYSYEEVERILIQPGGGASSVPPSPSEENPATPDNEESSTDDRNVQSYDEASEINDTDQPGDTEIFRQAEALDHQASQEEEQRLWKLFPQIVQKPLQTDHAHDLPKRKEVSRTSEDRAPDWRDYMNYQKPWQRHKAPVSPTKFVSNRLLRRRKPAPRPMSDISDLSEPTQNAEEQDEASLQGGFLDRAMDDFRSEVEIPDVESGAEASDDEERAEDGQDSSPSDVENNASSLLHQDYEMRDADSEDDRYGHRGRSVKRFGSSVASTIRGNSPERDSRVASDPDDENEESLVSESDHGVG